MSSNQASPELSPIRSSETATKPENTGALDSLRLASNPHQMVDYVDEILGKLEAQFENMAGQVLKRMEQMDGRIDRLERSICDLLAEADGMGSGSNAKTNQPAGLKNQASAAKISERQ